MLTCSVVVLQTAHADVVAGTYQELYYSQTLDHFNPQDHSRWDHRYLFSDEHWDGAGSLVNGCKGPILLYTGNEGPIDAFWNANGFMIDDLAPKWGALLVFPEERYYGKSLPFGNSSSLGYEELRYLSTEQVLEDFVELVEHLKETLDGAQDCPVVAFGGSYGGTLTTFLRAAYPAVVIGGLAASAPIGYYDPSHWAAHGVDEFTFSDIITKARGKIVPPVVLRLQQWIYCVCVAILSTSILWSFFVSACRSFSSSSFFFFYSSSRTMTMRTLSVWMRFQRPRLQWMARQWPTSLPRLACATQLASQALLRHPTLTLCTLHHSQTCSCMGLRDCHR
jgi:pimeloyl-ACP methyl ester carboxylesterase